MRGRLQQTLLNWRHKRRRYRALNLITLNRINVLHNVKLLQRQHPGFSIIPVLKANAYGHGLRELAVILNDAACDLLAVDGYFEAGKIRFITKHRVLVLGYVLPENVPLLDTKRCSFVVQDEGGLVAFGRLGRPAKIHLEINTGMNRLGIAGGEIAHYLEVMGRYPSLELEGVMTHLADADNEQNAFTEAQVTAFDECIRKIMAAGYRPKYVHVAQTAGSAKVKSRYANAVRLGIGLYGFNPLAKSDPYYAQLDGLRPVLSLTSTIIKVIDLEAGDRVGYNGTFTAPKAMRIGVLPLGYYEGVPRIFSNMGAVVTHANWVLPIVGRVCMNHTMIDLRGNALRVGDRVEVFAAEAAMPNSIAQTCIRHHLFAYELLVKLSSSIRRQTI